MMPKATWYDQQNRELRLTQGQTIQGRWNGRSYRVIRRLGVGAVGTVYLVQERDRKFALKISQDANGIALEYRVLQLLQQQIPNEPPERVRGQRLGPFVSDMDDLTLDDGRFVFFYTMEYIAGVPAAVFAKQKGMTAIQQVAVQLLTFLKHLHVLGYAFGDLKADNVMVHPLTGMARMIDFGGVTKFGEGIRQYTEWNDRGYWHRGTRRADCQYDLFAVAMLIVQLLLPQLQWAAGEERGLEPIRKLLSVKKETKVWLPVIETAWQGGFRDAGHMLQAILSLRMPVLSIRFTERMRRILAFIDREMTREWDWTHWLLTGMAGLCLAVLLRLLMVQ